MSAVVLGFTAMAWSVSADREHRDKMPEVRPHLMGVGAYSLGRSADRGAAGPLLSVKMVE